LYTFPVISAARVLWEALIGVYDEAFLLLRANLPWLLFSLPFALLPMLCAMIVAPPGEGEYGTGAPAQLMLTGLILLLVPNPASLGMYRLAAIWQRKNVPPFSAFLAGARENLGLGIALYLVGAGGLLVLIVNAYFYLQPERGSFQVVSLLFLYLVLFWLCLQLYLGGLVELLGERQLTQLYRRAALLAIANPIYSLVLLFAVVFVMLLSLIAPLLFASIAMAFVALVGTRALGTLKKRYDPQWEADEELEKEPE
jgi:uncharacterized membrane protein YesL